MHSKNKTIHYMLINMAYFAAYSGVHAYVSVFLLDRGFSNTSIGILLALANILSVIFQPISAGWIDKYEKFTNRKVSMVCALICAIACMALCVTKSIALIFIIYVILYTLQMVYQPLIQAMYFEYEKMGAKINFGLCRGLGSCGFAITSFFTGRLIVSMGVSVTLIINIATFLAGLLALATFLMPEAEENVKISADAEAAADADIDDVAHNSLIEFIKCYPLVMIFVLGGTCLFFCHNALNDYLIQIITPLGGNESTMGSMVMVAALLELPAMATFTMLEKKIGLKTILILSAVMFTVKSLLMWVAPNIVVAYISQACQIFAYALFIPGGAYLAEKAMGRKDKTKGQAYISCAITLGGVFSALVCGRVLDVAGVNIMLAVTTIVGAIGTVIAVGALLKMNLGAK